MRFFLLGLVAALVSVLSLACSSGGDDGTVIEVNAQNMRFVPDVIQVPAGQEVTLRLKNLDENEHDLEIKGLTPANQAGGGHGGEHESSSPEAVAVHAQAKKTASIKFMEDTPGTYEVVCTVPGHEQSGMVARLIVS